MLYLLITHDRNFKRSGLLAIDGKVVKGSRILRPKSWVNKRVGLLNHTSIPDYFGLWLANTSRVHTVGMLTDIDIIFIDNKNIVVEILRAVEPGEKKIRSTKKVAAILELKSGSASLLEITIGSHLETQLSEKTNQRKGM